MIHHQRIQEIQEALEDLDGTLDQSWSAEAETRLFQEQTDLRDELERLRSEQELYREDPHGERDIEIHVLSKVVSDSDHARLCGRAYLSIHPSVMLI